MHRFTNQFAHHLFAVLLASVALIALVAIAPTPATAQLETEQRKFRLAQSYEQSSDYRNSARIYQELYTVNKQVAAYFDGAVRSLLALNQPAAALPLVEEYLQAQEQERKRLPDERTIELLSLKADLLWKTGKPTQATETWSKALSTASSSTARRDSSYLKIAYSQAGNRAFEPAIAALLQGRKDLNAPVLFSDQLSQLYGAAGNFTAGTKEVLTLLRLQGAQNVARGRLAAYLISEKGATQTREVLAAAANGEQNNAPLQRLYSWFLREIKDYAGALDITARLDNLTNAQGRELYEFAEAARRDGAYSPALAAFGMIIDKGKRNPYAVGALYGYARTAESKLTEASAASGFAAFSLAERGSIAIAEVNALIDRYNQIIRDYPATEPAVNAQYRIATLTHEYIGKSEQAIAEFTKLFEQYRVLSLAVQQMTQSQVAQGMVDLGNLYIELQRLPEAETTFQRVLATFASAQSERDEAAFHLAELEYFRCALDPARERFGKLAVNPNADIANDALEMIGTLEYQDTPVGKDVLCLLAQADLAARQRLVDAALAKYTGIAEKVAAKSKEAPLGEQALLRAGNLERGRKRYNEAIKLFERQIQQYPEGTAGDYAMLHTGDCLAAQGKKDEAIQAYSTILVKYPRSTLLQEARTKIRKLRGDV